MLIDVRTYKCKPNTLKKHLELYEKHGKKPQVKNLGHPLLFLATETGDPNEYIHVWGYDDAADREKKRGELWKDKNWLSYVEKSAKLGALISQSNKLMKPVDFFKIQI